MIDSMDNEQGGAGVPKPREPVPWEVHFGLQHEFVALAALLGVEVTHGMTFEEARDACVKRARVASTKADQYEQVLAQLDGATDALDFAASASKPLPQVNRDVTRAWSLLNRALATLRELAGKPANDPKPKAS